MKKIIIILILSPLFFNLSAQGILEDYLLTDSIARYHFEEVIFETSARNINFSDTLKVAIYRSDTASYEITTDSIGQRVLKQEAEFGNVSLSISEYWNTPMLKDTVLVGMHSPEKTGSKFSVVSVHDQIVLRGKTYYDVICIHSGQQTELFEENERAVYEFFQRGKGLVYAYQPYPISQTYADIEFVRID